MSHRTCTVDGCGKPHQARGLCNNHYSQEHRRKHGRPKVDRTCLACGESWRVEASSASRYCSQFCQIYDRLGPQLCAWKPPRPKKIAPPPFQPEAKNCLWCDAGFTAEYRNQVYCSADHKIRAKRVRRRGRQYGWTSNFTWAEVMRVWRKFDHRCAYCEQSIVGLPDPDHVVPLSRGGSNSIANILPSCSPCNSDKRDLLLEEWNPDRERRNLPLRRTQWDLGDPRVSHLTVLAAVA